MGRFPDLETGYSSIPLELPPPQTRPAAIKEAMPFTEKDGEVFRGLGRKAELEGLLGYVLDDQVPLVVLMRESGAGQNLAFTCRLV